mmetsp:Transcript_31167/g.41231  ORF Transcript_31167/g.41231 Transcript_31167/m.41231 type:complete len:527 (+) Transcript_31167:333-1913(+)|eukprot:CAMPEP_0117767736 /NCGR_PEP_ID=MMETSP0947-20121206/21852_1 /TAXON_ID=44440 /ORGANISM="Chattonella subsalsa, Strain CCMP2191" /LENGTH=526 /DNA_ID=CAMNT_0005591573 /DNA_START=171 /DNA_END=1751 /DNA_ORIENTATION=-
MPGEDCAENEEPTFFESVWIQLSIFVEWTLETKAMTNLVNTIHNILKFCWVPEPHPNAEQVGLCICATLTTLIGYYFLFGNRHRHKRRRLQKELREAEDRVRELEELLTEAEIDTDSDNEKEIRIFMDGAFDLMHYGHMNAFRRGRSLGTHLVVGVNSDASIKECKGPPVNSEEERIIMVEGCKFVDEVVPNCPYIMNEEYLKWVIKEYQIDYVVHGDDPCIVNGKDVYEVAQKMGKYRTIPRTEGVSTTDIVGRMLLMGRWGQNNRTTPPSPQLLSSARRSNDFSTALSKTSKFLTTSRMLRLFSAGVKAPPKDARVVYIDGAWDMFHAGHVSILKKAREYGDYLVVGVQSDELVNSVRGFNMPLLTMNERVLSVLGCKYADDVLIDSPWVITREMIASLNICAVVHWRQNECSEDARAACEKLGDPYTVPIEMGIFHIIESPVDLTLASILERIHFHQDMFQKKIAKKQKVEEEYYNNRYGFTNGTSSTINAIKKIGSNIQMQLSPSKAKSLLLSHEEQQSTTS